MGSVSQSSAKRLFETIKGAVTRRLPSLEEVERLRQRTETLTEDLSRLKLTLSQAERPSPDEPGEFFLRNEGYCPICQAKAVFVARNAWLRDYYLCTTCGSIPRERSVIAVLESRMPKWRAGTLHESSPSATPASNYLRANCPGYLATQFFPGVTLGQQHQGVRCENLEHQTFADASFDLVVTQDVLEHVFDPDQVFREIARTLKPGGAHVFTTPIYKGLQVSRTRAVLHDGQVKHLEEPPEYHGNPIDGGGALVTVHYGQDLCDRIFRACGLVTERISMSDFSCGTVAEFLDVLVTTKPA
jgi:SAM-dependent methyltransferase